MRFYIIFYTNVMSGLTLLCADLRFGLPRASPPPQSPILRYFSPLLDFLLPPLCLKVQSSAISRSFWTSAHLPSTSKSNPPLFLAPFGLPRISPPLQSPICHSCSLLLDFLASPLHFKVQSSALSHSFWTSSHLPSTSKSNLPLLLAPFGLPPASPLPQSPILRSFSLLLDFRVPPLRFKVHSATLARSFWTSSCLPSASRSNPPLFLAPFGLSPASPPPQGPFRHAPAPHHAKKADCKAIRLSHSGNSNPPVSINQSNPPSANSTK